MNNINIMYCQNCLLLYSFCSFV